MHDALRFRRLPVGAELLAAGGAHFRVWAPACRKVEVMLQAQSKGANDHLSAKITQPLEAEPDGYYSGIVAAAAAGDRYWYRLDGRPELLADPVSRFQPEGPDGPSEIIDSQAFSWSDANWPGVGLAGQVLYEMHVGTFTRAGTWQAAAEQLSVLAADGMTVVALMPVADFRGTFGWGYDGVNQFAPTRLYGRPDDFRRFVDRAHAVGLGVILDVVYNHLGPGGEFLKRFSPHYFTDRYKNEWGEAINFDGPQSEDVREYFVANAGYWVEEYHIDGLRIDATQQVFDSSPRHVLGEISCRVHEAAGRRKTLIVGENEPQNAAMLELGKEQRCGIDALWNDDFHHAAMVALTGRNEAYYSDYRGQSQEFVSAAKWGYLYQGQRYKWQGKRRGTPALHLKPAVFVNYLQNHDQIANSGRGQRLHELTSPGRARAMTALWLLMPQTPMFFQGQEFAASSPFLYFADRQSDAEVVAQGRAEFLAQFRSLALPEMQARLPSPTARESFERAKLDFSDRQRHAELYALHRDLLKLRREDPAFSAQRHRGLDGAVLGEHALVLRFFADEGDRLLLVNLGLALHLDPAPEPLLAPPLQARWELLWSSENFHYGGTSTPPLDTDENWRIPGEAAVVLRASVAQGEPHDHEHTERLRRT